MIRIFCSYASADSAIVLRIHNDLARSQDTRIWCFEIDGRPGYNFREEYLESIRSADFFLLFDSPAARASRYVKEEVAEWQKGKRPHPILPCLAVPRGAWRDKGELFADHNFQRFVDLTNYVPGVEELHESLGTTPVPSFTKPRDREFADELLELREFLDSAAYSQAWRRYQAFEAARAHHPDLALAQLEVMIEDIRSTSHREVGSALLTLADDYFVLNRFDPAIRTFRRVCECRPQDPRGWAGLAFAQAKREDYAGAAENFDRSLQAIDRSGEEAFLENRIEIVNALCSALILLRNYGQAWSLIQSEIAARRANAVSYGFGARLQLQRGYRNRARRWLAEATRRISRRERADPSELSDLIDVARQLGDGKALATFADVAQRRFPDQPRLLRDAAAARADLGDPRTAMHHLEQAWRLDREDLRVGVELALLKRQRGETARAEEILSQLLHNSTAEGEQAYYIGLAHHLLGRRQCAEYFLESARENIDVRSWPRYREI